MPARDWPLFRGETPLGKFHTVIIVERSAALPARRQ